ncbi:beta-ketoacyl synthase N-terminal-like domain-containing protein [Mycobacterium sp. pUA109]|uniref:beta-ketoacyl synthase N-terminal-like domain-containing protein n=1 Tax=Mycobacterium sp. pUA109 TaxID=3238982 RepID=UPI00351B2816
MLNESRLVAPATLLHLMRHRAVRYRDKMVFDYADFSSGGAEHHRLSYHKLDLQARAIAGELQRQGAAGERVLVLCPSGVDFIAGLFGCIYAGAVAIPVHPPVRTRVITRVASIVADAQAGVVLTTADSHAELKAAMDGMADTAALRWCTTNVDEADTAAHWVAPNLDPDAPVLVQYTSGSTSSPKGVVLTHRNLLANLEAIRRAIDGNESTIVVSWLPLHHDMGLIGAMLGTLYLGGSCYLMPPEAFIQHPMRWLETLSASGANVSVAPNFAYDLCVERSSAAERAALDLSHWTTAMSGAEPVNPTTLQRFAEAFAPAGFRDTAFRPVYGLAEATLLVTAGAETAEPVQRHVDPVALRDHHVVDLPSEHPGAATLIGCGTVQHGVQAVIADPVTRRQCRADEIGEIWVAGASVAQGYLGKPTETEETFSAYLSDTGRGPFLRTGDMGFLRDGELFIAGRLKDLIIIRGANYYPNDLEATAQDSHPALLRGRGAAFAVTSASNTAEQLVVVQEVDRDRIADVDAVIDGIRTAITERHEIQVHGVVLVEPLRIPTTSSGKIRRRACRQRFLDGALEVFAQWHAPTAGDLPPPAAPADVAAPEAERTAEEITAWVVTELGAALGLAPSEIDPTQPFASYGLDSVHAIWLTTALETWLGRKLSPTLAYDYPTIERFARHLAGDTHTTVAQADGAAPAAASDEPIAIIGLGCRFPGADGPAAFWRLLADGTDAVTATPPHRWALDAGRATPRWGGFLDQVDQFDPQFFGISPQEAACMDPQQRLLLEVAWEALEDAGQVPDRLAGSRTGVFIGIATNDYGALRRGGPALLDGYTGNTLSVAANRISYLCDFRGPSMAIDTACSSSLVAVHQACRSLCDGESTLALAGGVNLVLSPRIDADLDQAGLLAADGRCKTFDARADGFVRGEGAGIVVLKPLSRALADGDPVYAVIRGSAVNQDGRSNGLTAASRAAQEAVVAEAYRRAELPPGAAQYVETHGAGTYLGDLIEAEALGTVLAQGRGPDDQCLIGSVKTNIGHLGAAAGVAGLIKVALALHHRAIPPSLNCAEPNPHLPLDSLRVAQQLVSWPDHGGRAVAGVSAFGLGGANAHLVVTEAPQVRVAAVDDQQLKRAELLPLSARSAPALTELAGRYAAALRAGTAPAELCHTAGARRGHHDYRLAAVGGSAAELSAALDAHQSGAPHPGLVTGRCRMGQRPGVVFLFSGRGSQWPGMGQRLAAEEPTFAAALAACESALRPHLAARRAEPADTAWWLNDIGIVGPALFAVQVALAALWRSWGVQPDAVLGHGLGEVAAAHVAGTLSLDDAARVVCARAGGSADPDGSQQLRDELAGLLDAGRDTFVEISPQPILLDAVRDELGTAGVLLPSLRRDAPERATMLASLAALYTRGQPVAWQALHPADTRCGAAPTYPWQRTRCWMDSTGPTGAGTGAAAPAWRTVRSAADPQTVFVETDLGPEQLPVPTDRPDAAVAPAASLLKLVLKAAAAAFGAAPREVRNVAFHQTLELTDGSPRTVQVVFRGDPPEPVCFECHAAEPTEPGAPGWSLLASGAVATADPDRAAPDPQLCESTRLRCPDTIAGPAFYRQLAAHGLRYPPGMQPVQEVWRRDGEATARLTPVAADGDDFDATLVDACVQVLTAALPATPDSYRLVGLSELRVHRRPEGGSAWCHAVAHTGLAPEG